MLGAGDYTVWRNSLGATEDGSILNGNGNGGIVDRTDFDLWKLNFENSLSSAATSVPEPASILLLVIGFACLTTCRRTY